MQVEDVGSICKMTVHVAVQWRRLVWTPFANLLVIGITAEYTWFERTFE